jgi:hypothetical protein
MMDFHALLAKMKEIDSKPMQAPVNQMTQECGDPMVSPMSTTNMPAPPVTPPPTMSVNLNAHGMDNIEQMMKLFQKVNPDMMPKTPSLMSPISMTPPMAPEIPPLKMLPLDIDEPKPEMDKEPSMPMNITNTDNDSDEPSDMDVLGKVGDMDSDKPDTDDVEGPPEADDTDDDSDEKKEDGGFQAATTEPDTSFKSVDYMNNKLAGGMNKPKDTFPKVSDGDNPMQKVKESEDAFRASIRADLQRRLNEAKGVK